MKSSSKKVIKYSLSAALAVVLVWLTFRGIGWKEFWESLLLTNWWYISLSLVVSVLALVFRQLRWHMMLKPIAPDVRQIEVWDANNVGNLVSLAVPGVGEITRCAMIAGKRASFDKVFGTAVMERMWDLIAVTALLVITLFSSWNTIGEFFMDTIVIPASSRFSVGLGWIAAGALAAGCALAFLVWKLRDRVGIFGKITDAVRGVFEGLKASLAIKRKWLFAIYTALIWLMYILMSYYVLQAIPQTAHMGFEEALFISAVGNIASVIPVPGGMGAYHYLVAVSLTSLYGAVWNTGLLFATLSHESHGILVLITGLISYIFNSCRTKKN